MQQKLTNFLNHSIIKYIFFVFMILTAVFGRSFMGIYFFGFRLGEYLIGFGFVLFIIFLLNKNLVEDVVGEKIYPIFILIFFTFILFLFINSDVPKNTYLFKSSSYIWVISFIFIGYFFTNNLNLNRQIFILNNFLLFFVFYLNTLGYPDVLIDYFKRNADKFQFSKASEIILIVIIILWLNNRFISSKFNLSYFIITCSFFLPLFLVMSRGSALAFLIFLIFEIYNLKKYIFSSKILFLVTLIVSIFCFYISTTLIIKDVEIKEEGFEVMLDDILETKNINQESLLFFINDSRLYSADGNLNWRLQIWQDIIDDSSKELRFLKGQSYLSKINAMENPIYQGEDGSNENVHNYFFNIFARGGMIHLTLFLMLFYFLLDSKNLKYSKKLAVTFVLPAIIVSMFDSSMETPNYPFIFFFFIGQLFSNMSSTLRKK